MLGLVRDLVALRRAEDALRAGAYTPLAAPEGAWRRRETPPMSGGVFLRARRHGAQSAGAGRWSRRTAFPRATTSTARAGYSRGPSHKLAGEGYVGRMLVLDGAKGGVATAWMLHEMTARGVVPRGLVFNGVNPIMAQGAALADFTMISGFDADITQAIPNGAMVEVDPTGERPFIRIV